MKTLPRSRTWIAAFSLVLALLAGCQTWVPEAGVTLPSPHYLEHPPQYYPPSPWFPLGRELAIMKAINAAPEPGAQPPAILPRPVPLGP